MIAPTVVKPDTLGSQGIQTWLGVTYLIDLDLSRLRFVELTAERCRKDGRQPTMKEIAVEMGVSHMTLHRFFRGQQLALLSLQKILGWLRLEFQDVAQVIGLQAA